jgi:hypothetical protein
MAELVKVELIRVSNRGSGDQAMCFMQERKPFWSPPVQGSGYRYGHADGPQYMFGDNLQVESLTDGHNAGLRINHGGARSAGSDGLALGVDKNIVDVCMWGVPDDAPVESDVFDIRQLQVPADDVVVGKDTVRFERNFDVPILAGRLSIHLASEQHPRIPITGGRS